MNTRSTLITKVICAIFMLCFTQVYADIHLTFQRSGTDAKEVKITVKDQNGNIIEGAKATMLSSHPLMMTLDNIKENIICPNANALDKPNINLTFNIEGITTNEKFKVIALDIHAFNKNGGYQKNTNDKARKFNVKTQIGKYGETLEDFGVLNDIDIAANVGESGNVHQLWNITDVKEHAVEKAFQVNINITAGSENFGCFFGLSEIILKNEESVTPPEKVVPFKLSSAVGNAEACYAITSPTGKVLNMDHEGILSWTTNKDLDEQIWYFVEKEGTYLMVNLKNHRIYSLGGGNDTTWEVVYNNDNTGFYLIPTATRNDLTTKLTVEGESTLVFNMVHNAFARTAQIYSIPCQMLGTCYITKLGIHGDVIKTMNYPLAIESANSIIIPLETPNNEYTLYTKDKAVIATNKTFEITMDLNNNPTEALEGFIYFDWNRDGIFEDTQFIKLSQSSTVKITVPSDAKTGRSRVRIRLTDNGLRGAEDDVNGQIFDFVIFVTDQAPLEPTLTVKANSSERGTVNPTTESGLNKECKVVATPQGNSTFVCWQEGRQIISLDKEYTFTLNHNTELVAYFSPNTRNENTGVEEQMKESNHLISISTENKYIKVKSNAKVLQIQVFTADGKLIAQSKSNLVNLSGTDAGTYIVKVYTQDSDETLKVLIK